MGGTTKIEQARLEYSNLISESRFATHFTSFWQLCAPRLDAITRRINRGEYDRKYLPIKSTLPASDRAFINEAAFNLAEFYASDATRPLNFNAVLPNIINGMTKFAEKFGYDFSYIVGALKMSAYKGEVFGLAERIIENFVDVNFQCRIFRPKLKGAGILNSCEGDILFDNKIVEIKAGERNFRSIDFRQIIIYCALNKSSRQYNFTKFEMFNPRQGISIIRDIDEFCAEISGKFGGELLDEIIEVFSGRQISR